MVVMPLVGVVRLFSGFLVVVAVVPSVKEPVVAVEQPVYARSLELISDCDVEEVVIWVKCTDSVDSGDVGVVWHGHSEGLVEPILPIGIVPGVQGGVEAEEVIEGGVGIEEVLELGVGVEFGTALEVGVDVVLV